MTFCANPLNLGKTEMNIYMVPALKWLIEDCIKLKVFLFSKGNNQRVKGQPMEWEKMFANHTSDKELISKIYKELNLIARKQIT